MSGYWVVWSEEHGAWWAPGRHGYTRVLVDAGRYTEKEVIDIMNRANRYLPLGEFNELAIPDPVPIYHAGRAAAEKEG